MTRYPLAVKYLAVIVIGLGLLAALAGWSAAVQEGPWGNVPRILMGVVVFLAGPSIMVIKKRAGRKTRSDAMDGVESQVAHKAASAVFHDSLVLLVVLGTSFVIFGNYAHPAVMIFGLLVVLLVMYFTRHAIALRKMAR
jgi:hypothetical protein